MHVDMTSLLSAKSSVHNGRLAIHDYIGTLVATGLMLGMARKRENLGAFSGRQSFSMFGQARQFVETNISLLVRLSAIHIIRSLVQ